MYLFVFAIIMSRFGLGYLLTEMVQLIASFKPSPDCLCTLDRIFLLQNASWGETAPLTKN